MEGNPACFLFKRHVQHHSTSLKTRAPTIRFCFRVQLRRLPVYDLVHGSVLLITKRLYDASELKKDDQDQISTPYAMEHFNKAMSLSRK